MRRILLIPCLVVIGLVALALAPEAHAQSSSRTWVSGVGSDANPCSRTAPCQTFLGALAKTTTDGTVTVLDPGAFGPLLITKSVTIAGSEGSHSAVSTLGTAGITVDGEGIKVILRNLSLEGRGMVEDGIQFVRGAQLTVENCRIFSFRTGGGAGIRVEVESAARLMVKDTNITDCGRGVFLEASTGQLEATLDNVHIEGMMNEGLHAQGLAPVLVTVKDSVISHNNQDAVRANSSSTIISLDSNMIAFNTGKAVNAAVPGARIRISNNTIVDNGICIAFVPGATIESARNNKISGYISTQNPNGVFLER